MTGIMAPGGQETLEARLKSFTMSPLDPQKTIREIFGDMENWTIELGQYRFLLFPFNGQWWFYDFGHGYWKYTGYHAGEAKFLVSGRNIDVRVTKSKPGPPSTTQTEPLTGGFCMQCGAQLKYGNHFCEKCGTPVSPINQTKDQAALTCSNCGSRASTGKKFCTKCGARMP